MFLGLEWKILGIGNSATIGEHALITCESLANQRFTYLILKDEYKNKFNIFFLFYYCYKLKEYCLNCLNQGNFASVDMTKFNKFEFPIISLKEQERIVNILDKFDALCNDITRGLPAEIELRKKQYEYYRDKLLTFKEKKK
nr:restriction endonuclease subunit S [Brachyspira pilosicoli]